MSNPNQTPTVSPILPNSDLDFGISIKENNLALPDGLQSYSCGNHKHKWLLLCGRNNGLHGFDNDIPNFPADKQNRYIYVIDIKHQTIKRRALTDTKSGLTQEQIDYLSVTNAQFSQHDGHLYIVGGYGVDSKTNEFGTKTILSIIDIKGLIKWVEKPGSDRLASKSIRQISNPVFQITGGEMSRIKDRFLLVFGQDFEGEYGFADPPTFTQVYSQQVRTFKIKDGKVHDIHYHPVEKDPNYNRRDLNVKPRIYEHKGKLKEALVAYSGVFTPNDGIWTVPVEISDMGNPTMADPTLDSTFKQGMNNYDCATVVMYSIKKKELYTIFLGGITYGFFEGDTFQTDTEIPFTNQCTTVKIDHIGQYTQYIMDGTYPTIASTTVNPGNTLLFGTDGEFFLEHGIKTIKDTEVIDYDKLPKGHVKIGYVVGGIASTLPNTSTRADTFASERIFNVCVNKQ